VEEDKVNIIKAMKSDRNLYSHLIVEVENSISIKTSHLNLYYIFDSYNNLWLEESKIEEFNQENYLIFNFSNRNTSKNSKCYYENKTSDKSQEIIYKVENSDNKSNTKNSNNKNLNLNNDFQSSSKNTNETLQFIDIIHKNSLINNHFEKFPFNPILHQKNQTKSDKIESNNDNCKSNLIQLECQSVSLDQFPTNSIDQNYKQTETESPKTLFNEKNKIVSKDGSKRIPSVNTELKHIAFLTFDLPRNKSTENSDQSKNNNQKYIFILLDFDQKAELDGLLKFNIPKENEKPSLKLSQLIENYTWSVFKDWTNDLFGLSFVDYKESFNDLNENTFLILESKNNSDLFYNTYQIDRCFKHHKRNLLKEKEVIVLMAFNFKDIAVEEEINKDGTAKLFYEEYKKNLFEKLKFMINKGVWKIIMLNITGDNFCQLESFKKFQYNRFEIRNRIDSTIEIQGLKKENAEFKKENAELKKELKIVEDTLNQKISNNEKKFNDSISRLQKQLEEITNETKKNIKQNEPVLESLGNILSSLK